MNHALYLAWRALVARRLDTAILVASIALILFVPAGTRVLVARGSAVLAARADATPLVVGAKGSALELVLSALYFESDPPVALGYEQVQRIEDSGLADALPIHARFRARDHAIVGTTLEYLDFRGLEIAEGREMGLLGECVLGAAAAHSLELGPGDTLVSTPESVFDLAGVYPLEMSVVGVFAATGTADDRAVFTDIKTAWVIEGLGHGHQDVSAPAASANVLTRDGTRIVANAALRQYQRITPENVESFHFHGDRTGYPVTAVLALPSDAKSETLLLGRYLGDQDPAQIARPAEVMDELVATVSNVESFVLALSALVGLAATATAVLVFSLSLRLRRREMQTLDRIGAARSRITAIYGLEIGIVLALGCALAALLTVATAFVAPLVLRMLLLS